MPLVDSSLLEAAIYHELSAQLELAFHNGSVYCYSAVPAQTYHELLQAESKGKYFNSHIRNHFGYAKIHSAGGRRPA